MYNFRIFKKFYADFPLVFLFFYNVFLFLQHFSFSEYYQDDAEGKNHEREDNGGIPSRVGQRQFQIHPVKPRNESRRHEKQGHQRKDLHYLVLVQIDKTDHRILEIFQTFETEIGMVDQ